MGVRQTCSTKVLKNNDLSSRNAVLSLSTQRVIKNTPPTTGGGYLLDLGGGLSGYKQLYECLVCGSKFRSLKQMYDHYSRRHSRYKRVRYKTVIVSGKYIQKQMNNCHTQQIIFRHSSEYGCECKHEKVIYNSCYIRICPKCEGVRRYRYIKKYKDALLNFKRVSVVTLTFKGHHLLDKKTKQQFEQQTRNFMKRLERHLRYRLQYVRVLEVVRKPEGYYYHYHFLMDLPYIKQTKLSKMWCENTGSYIVWIEALKDKQNRPVGVFWNRLSDKQKLKNSTNYITKYLSKPLSNITKDQYARFVYSNHFVETRLTCIMGRIRPSNYGLVCSKCGEKLFFDEILTINPLNIKLKSCRLVYWGVKNGL